ncbi:HepT-like ribonuclease domain-containing protein [Duganella sp. S19_KUP01_CR8]|uniref:HepT-like ribonuclease domain-containing protein n=1 Tax=Duganella sp. S19_KUP01_CR8 TaxID=3025502 RepID=UPI002FCD8745
MQNELVQDAVIRNLEILGEASNNIQKYHPEFVMQHPELPLAFAYQMRNAVVHGYFNVDYEIVWKTIQADLPALNEQIRNVIVDMAGVG